jgi:hypothetical protein
MWGSSIHGRGGADVLQLEAYAERAGAALACAYSNSAEFDAALIAARRAAASTGRAAIAARCLRLLRVLRQGSPLLPF